MLKFIVWGIGKLGKTCVDILGTEKVEVIVDRNPQSAEYRGIPVVGSDVFLEKYDGSVPVIITPRKYEKDIERTLRGNGILNYFLYSLNETRILWFCGQFPKERMLEDFEGHEVRIYGNNVLSLLVADYLLENGVDVSRGHGYGERDAHQGIAFLTEDGFPDTGIGRRVISYRRYFLDWELYRREELEVFRNLHAGEACFVVANGPSLRPEDLEKLHDRGVISFGVNGIFRAFPQTQWRPTYYMIDDPSGYSSWQEEINGMDGVEGIFIADVCSAYGTGPDLGNKYFWHLYYEFPNSGGVQPYFSPDFSRGGFGGKTVVYDGALQMAAYMGFSRIYLIGADCSNNSDGESDHFYPRGNSRDEASHLDTEAVFRAYRTAEQYADGHGIKIYNATRGGELEVFERVDFDSLFEDEFEEKK